MKNLVIGCVISIVLLNTGLSAKALMIKQNNNNEKDSQADAVIKDRKSKQSDEKIRIAVSDFKAVGVPGTTSATISNMIRTEISNIGTFKVLERSQMDKILKEQGFQQTGCVDTECAVKIGKILSAQKMLIGEVSKMGASSIIITGRIVDIESGTAETGVSVRALNDDDLFDAIKRFADELAGKIEGKSDKKDETIEEKKAKVSF